MTVGWIIAFLFDMNYMDCPSDPVTPGALPNAPPDLQSAVVDQLIAPAAGNVTRTVLSEGDLLVMAKICVTEAIHDTDGFGLLYR